MGLSFAGADGAVGSGVQGFSMLFACSRGAWALGDQGLLFFLHLRSLGSEFSCGFGFLASGLRFEGSMLNDLGCRGAFLDL